MPRVEDHIRAELWPDKDRLWFLPRMLDVGRNLGLPVEFENYVYGVARHVSKDYGGGAWAFYELSNKGFFIQPDDTKAFDCEIAPPVGENGWKGQLSAAGFGVLCSMFALNRMTYAHTHNVHLGEQYYRLRDYIFELPERDALLAAID